MTEFVAWQRPALRQAGHRPRRRPSRLRAELPITLHDDAGDVSRRPADFLLAGPGDVAAPRRRRRSSAGGRTRATIDAEATMMAHVELAAADLPWRYSPVPYAAGAAGRAPVAGARRRPARRGRAARRRPRRASPAPSCSPSIRSAPSHRWAHVHDVGGRRFSRVVSPAPADDRRRTTSPCSSPAGRRTVAADGSTTLVDSWPTPTGSVTLPCFDRWTFRTTADPGDFASIARRLDPLTPDGGGRAAPRCSSAGPRSASRPFAAEPLRGRRRADGGARPGRRAGGRRRSPTRSPPRSSSLAGEIDARRPLGADPAALRRAVAPGSGRRRGVAVAAARRRRAARRLAPRAARRPAPPWRGRPRGVGGHRVAGPDQRRRRPPGRRRRRRGAAHPPPDASASARRAACGAGGCRPIRSPAWRRCRPCSAGCRPTRGGSALDAVDGRTPALLARPVQQRGAADAASPRPAGPRRRARRHRARRADRGGQHLPASRSRSPTTRRAPIDVLADPARARATRRARCAAASCSRSLTAGRRRAGGAGPRPRRSTPEQQAIDLLVGLRDPLPVDTCAPLPDLGAFAGVGRRRRRPDRRATGRRRPGARHDHRPARRRCSPSPTSPRSWTSRCGSSSASARRTGCCPAPATSPTTASSRCRPTPSFVDALLIGANHQTLGELRWRNIPITTRWTPLRRFWQRISVAGGEPLPDIRLGRAR